MRTAFEKYLEKNTLILGKNLLKTEKNPFDNKFLKIKSMKGGMHTYVTKVWDKNSVWAIKEGRSDSFIPISKNFEFPVNREFWDMLLSPLGLDIMPNDDKIAKELREYFLVAKYLGYFDKERFKVLGDNEFIIDEQKQLRKDLFNFDKKDSEIASLVKRLLNNNFEKSKILKKAICKKGIIDYNFLVKEFVILSKPTKSKFEKTFYIIQEWAEGHPLSDSIEEDFSKKVLGRLIVFIILSLFLFEQEQKVIDTRGSGVFNTNWFEETENVVINTDTDEVKFIDTRSLWDLTGNFIEKGIFSSDMLLHSFIQSFEHYLDEFKKRYHK